MADNDIYDNKTRYERFLERLDEKVLPPEERSHKDKRDFYTIRNPANVKYFCELDRIFKARNNSYQRRLRLFGNLVLAAHATEKDFSQFNRENIDGVIAFMHTRYKSPKSKRDFILDIKHIWRLLFPENDEQGRPDETRVPYVVRHLSAKMDKSTETMRTDRLTWEEFERILGYFSSDPRMQAYIMLALESLGRPQELLTRKIKNVKTFDHHAKIWLTEHGKEGPGLLQCIDSYPYLIKWLEVHPDSDNPEAWLFPNLGQRNRGKQLKPRNVNKKLSEACKDLSIPKNITAYSLKRNGVTFRLLRGDNPHEVMHAARWVSIKQLKTYDLSVQEDAMKRELIKRGLMVPENGSSLQDTEARTCVYCGTSNGFTERFCGKCKRPLERDAIKDEIRTMEALRKQVTLQSKELEHLKQVAEIAVIGTAKAGKEGKVLNKEYFKNLIKEMFEIGELNL